MRVLLLIISLAAVLSGYSQSDSSQIDFSKYQRVYMDTGWVFVLKDLEKKESDSYYYRARYKVKKMYPFALFAVDLLTSLDDDISDDVVTKKTKRKARKANRQLKKDFRKTIKSMSKSDGIIRRRNMIYRV